MSKLSAFDEPQKTIKWAEKAIDEGEAIRESTITKKSFATVSNFDATTGETITKVIMKGSISDDIGRKYTEALNNLRNSFDQSIFAAASAIGKPMKDAHYPWADNPGKSLDARLKGTGKPGKTIPVELWDTIRAHEPYATSPAYPGGNDLIRQLAAIANAKHTVGFKTDAALATIMHPSARIERFEGGGHVRIAPFGETWDPVKNEIIVRRTKNAVLKSDNKYRITFYIAFDAPSPVGDVPAELALRVFAQEAQNVLDTLKARCCELGAS